MGRLYINVKARVMKTVLGPTLRKLAHKKYFKRSKAEEVVEKTWPDETPEEKKRIVNDMLQEARKYEFTFDEYVFHCFRNRPTEERREYISIFEGIKYCEKLNQPKNQILFDDKGETYRVFGKYFHRDQVEVFTWTAAEVEKLRDFITKHPRFIIKPFSGANGVGIRIVDLAEEGPFEKLCATLKSEYANGFVAEELIKQAAALSAVNASSVNTMRVITIRMNDRVEILPCAWRCGTGGRCVDNGGSGGIFCALDDDGVIYSTADEHGNSYEEHPDSKVRLIGFQVPRYSEALELAKELAMVVPDNRYTGWDLALTEEGWILQEANAHGGIVAFQTPMRRGCRTRMDAIMKELGL